MNTKTTRGKTGSMKLSTIKIERYFGMAEIHDGDGGWVVPEELTIPILNAIINSEGIDYQQIVRRGIQSLEEGRL